MRIRTKNSLIAIGVGVAMSLGIGAAPAFASDTAAPDSVWDCSPRGSNPGPSSSQQVWLWWERSLSGTPAGASSPDWHWRCFSPACA